MQGSFIDNLLQIMVVACRRGSIFLKKIEDLFSRFLSDTFLESFQFFMLCFCVYLLLKISWDSCKCFCDKVSFRYFRKPGCSLLCINCQASSSLVVIGLSNFLIIFKFISIFVGRKNSFNLYYQDY